VATDNGGDEGRPSGRQPYFWVMIVLGVLLAAAALAGGSGSKKKAPTRTTLPGSRAVLVPTADRERTVVVPACNTPPEETRRDVERGEPTLGAAVIGLPRTPGVRTLLVAKCLAETAAEANGPLNPPSAVFVLPVGSPTNGSPTTFGAESQVIVPNESPVTTVVVPPCPAVGQTGGPGSARGPALVVRPLREGSDVAAAPQC
jgi:hypothetical protein